MTVTQTPINYNPPPALHYNITRGSSSSEGKAVDKALTGIQKNSFVPTMGGPHPLAGTWKQIDALRELGENWNGYSVAAPNPNAIEAAKQWILSLYNDIIVAEYPWRKPHVSADEDGNAVFEWVHTKKRLTIYVSPNEALYIKAWGPSIISDMSDGDAGISEERQGFWAWFVENSVVV